MPSLTGVQQAVVDSLADHCFDEGVCWPSQQRISDQVGVSRQTVNAAIRQLVELGVIRIKERRWGRFSGWLHCVYELLVEFKPRSSLVARRITRQAHKTPKRRHFF